MENRDYLEKRSQQAKQGIDSKKNRSNIWPYTGATAADLIRNGYRILISSDLLETQGFRNFHKEWIRNSPQSVERLLFVSSLDFEDADITLTYEAMKILRYTECNDYVSFFRNVKKMGTWLYLTADERKVESIIAASREAGAFLRVYLLDGEGKIKYCRVSTLKDSNASINAMNSADVYDMPAEIFPVKKVIRRTNRAPMKGDVVFDSNNRSVRLGDEFISNPQSITYHTDLIGVQAKIYQAPWLSISYFEDKARRMLKNPIHCDGICWPIDLLHNVEGEFVGIIVPAAEGYQLKQQVMSQQGLAEHFPEWNRRNLAHLTGVILEKIVFLQERNILFGLVNPGAIFVKDEDHVYFAEMDTYQIEGYPILSHERVMQAPELQNIGGGMRLYTKEQDNYGIALLVFMLLMPGKFPYNKGNNMDITESIRNMAFAFRYGRQGEEHGAKEYFGSWRFAWSHLGNELKQAFYYTFQGGQPYSNPKKRKDANFWLGKVNSLEKELVNPYDKESLQIFPRTFKRYSGTRTIRCEKCGIDHPDFYYRYPERRICNSCLGQPSKTHFVCKSCNKSFYYDFGTLFKYERLVETKSFSMPTHCPYCRSDKRKCVACGHIVPAYRLNDDGMCFDCSKAARDRISKRYYCNCGNQITLTQGQVEFYMKKFGRLPQRCDQCRASRRNGY